MLLHRVVKVKRCPRLSAYASGYAVVSEIHGVRYFVEPGRSICERIFWSVVSALGLGIGIILILFGVDRFETSPIYISFDNDLSPIFEIPFPVITICPEGKGTRTKFNYTDTAYAIHNKRNITPDDWKLYQYWYLICDQFPPYQDCGELFVENITDFFYNLYDLSPNVMDMMVDCKLFGAVMNCSDIFDKVITEEGICYSFNMLDRGHFFADDVIWHGDAFHANFRRNDYDPDNGFAKKSGLDTYPRRALYSGIDNGFEVFLKQRVDDHDLLCKSAFSGFRLHVHHHTEIPRPTDNFVRIPLDSSILVQLQIRMTVTSESVKRFSPKRRGCYLHGERRLRFFEFYSAPNCKAECIRNYTLEICECIPFHLPREKNWKICGSGSMDCIKKVIDSLRGGEAGIFSNHEPPISILCDCLPMCTLLAFDMTTNENEWLWREYIDLVGLNNSISEGESLTTFLVYFRSSQFLKLVRKEVYGILELIAHCGGIFNLFQGISLITCLEIIYFLTLRLCCNRKMYGSFFGPYDTDEQVQEHPTGAGSAQSLSRRRTITYDDETKRNK